MRMVLSGWDFKQKLKPPNLGWLWLHPMVHLLL